MVWATRISRWASPSNSKNSKVAPSRAAAFSASANDHVNGASGAGLGGHHAAATKFDVVGVGGEGQQGREIRGLNWGEGVHEFIEAECRWFGARVPPGSWRCSFGARNRSPARHSNCWGRTATP